jgi:hypothetical protein
VAAGLLVWLNKEGLYMLGFAKHLAMMGAGQFPNTILEHIQRALNPVQRCYKDEELSMNPSKMGLMLSTKKKEVEGFVEPVLLNTVLHTTTSLKYLGVILDAKLTWRKYIKQRISKAYLLFGYVRGLLVRLMVLNQKLCSGCTQGK